MKLKECLEKTTKTKLEKINNEYSEEKLTIEQLEEQILVNLPVKSITFSDKEFKCLFDLKDNKKIDKIENYLLDMGYIYKIKNDYILPEEIHSLLESFGDINAKDERLMFIVSFYISANGALDIDKLVELVCKSGIKITKEKLQKIIKKDNYIVEKNRVYLGEIVKVILKNVNLFDHFEEYKVFNLKEVMDIVNIKEEYFPNEVKKRLKNKVADNNQIEGIISYFISSLSLGADVSDLVDELMNEKILKISKKEKNELIDFLNNIEEIIPLWTAGGYSYLELYNEEEERINRLKKLSLKENVFDIIEKLYNQILIYVTINGVIDINDLVNILNEHHGLGVSKEDILEIISNDENIYIYKNYLNVVENDKEIIKELLKSKKVKNEYKIIDDAEKTLDEFDEKYDELEKVIEDYNINGDAKDTILSVMMFKNADEEMLMAILEYFKVKVNLKKVTELSKKLNSIKKQMPSWQLNGFKPCELSNQVQTKAKINRNDLCPCGSGLKYKKCCGK